MPRNYNRRNPIIIIGPSIAYLELTRGHYALIDSNDVGLAGEKNWCVSTRVDGALYAVTNGTGPNRRLIQIHRFLMNPKSEQLVDHINGNPLDNRRCNLRLATHGQNVYNTKVQKNNRLGIKGVHFDTRNRYHAGIAHKGKSFNLGRFDTAEQAHQAYQDAARRLHGEFARFK